MSTQKEKKSEKKAKVKSGTTETDKTRLVKDVIDAEKKYLGLTDQKQVRGLAVSGGGIRSASFGLGVMQALVANNQLEKMDYMSTVSGGGYLGSALTWALKQGGAEVGITCEKFPLGKKGEGARGTATENNPHLDAGSNKLLNFIRQHCSYLVPTSRLGMVSFAAVVLRSMLISLAVYFCMLVVLMTLFEWGHFFKTPMVEHAAGGDPFHIIPKGIFITLSVVCIVICMVWGFLYSLRTYFVTDGVLNEYLWFIFGQTAIGYLWKASLVCAFIGILPYITGWIDQLGIAATEMAGGTSTLFGTLVGLWQYRKAQKNEETTSMFSEIMVYLGAFALMYGLLLLAYLAAGTFFEEDRVHLIHPLWLAGFALITLIFAVFVNLNLVGPHRIWRDRLMEAFMPDKEAVDENEWKPAKKADSALMEDMCDPINPRPYHIVNTNIILAESPQVKFKGRGGDNFIISRLYSGSDATGWRTTGTFHKSGARGMTLATAMATSAAALNPNAGVSGEGATRNLIISILLSVLNLRLGYWASNPAKNIGPFPPNFLTPGLVSEIARNGFTENDSRVLLSDGGHFENLAIYELIRRKLDLIVLSDGGADPGFNFDDLANVVEKARVDFGAKIVFRDDYGLGEILPGTKKHRDTNEQNEYQKKYAIAERGFAIADIYYPEDEKPKRQGILVYLKLAMIEGLPTDVYSYKGVNPTFPHQSTADQFFDEKQFEAYRELGYNVAWKMMESEEGKRLFF